MEQAEDKKAGVNERQKDRQILVVIANVLERAKLRNLLEAKNHSVRDAKDAKQAMGVLCEVTIDLAIIDLELGGISGKDLMYEMEQEQLAVPIIVLARDTSVEAAVECMRHGAVNILSRPFDESAFIGAVHGALLRQDQFQKRQQVTTGRVQDPAEDEVGVAPAPAAGLPAEDIPAVRMVKMKLDQGSLNLPTIPAVLRELKRVLDDPKHNTSELIRLVEADQELAVKVLRRANSAAFRGSSAVASISNALVRLGGRSVLSIALRTMTDRICRTLRHPDLADLSVELWRRTVEVAIAARIVGRTLSGAEPEEFYLHGLLSEMGEPFLIRFVDDVIRERPQQLNVDQVRRELSLYHSEVGAAVLKRWGMDESAVEVARHHHDANHMRVLIGGQEPLGKILVAVALARHAVRHATRLREQGEAQRKFMREALAEGREAEQVEVPEVELEPGHPKDPDLEECKKILRLRTEQFDGIVRALRAEIDSAEDRLTGEEVAEASA